MVIKPEAIPQFSGNVDAIEKHAGTLKSVGGQFRDIGADTHNTWQGLSAFYQAPEADKLFAATAPIKSSADTFGGQVEWVGSALSQYASTIRPIVEKLALLKSEATCFAGMVNADEDWREDEDKVNRNNDLIRQVDAQVAALMAAERTAANQINKLYGGTQWTVDDGSSQANMYGFNAADIPLEAEGRPWGDAAEVDEPWYVDTWNVVWSAGKGFVVDGLWGTVTGLFGLINPFDWETFTNSWHGIWMLTGNVFVDPGATGEAWLGLGKAFIAYDEWEKDPARATGTVLFNVITLPFAWSKISKAGPVARINANLARAAEVTKLSKIAELANAGKLAGLLKLDKVGLPTVRDLATQIDTAFKDVLARDPGLDAALRNADDLAARADTPTMRGDDIVGRADDVSNARRPALVGVGAAHADDLTSAGRVSDNAVGTSSRTDDIGRSHGPDDGSHAEAPDGDQSRPLDTSDSGTPGDGTLEPPHRPGDSEGDAADNPDPTEPDADGDSGTPQDGPPPGARVDRHGQYYFPYQKGATAVHDLSAESAKRVDDLLDERADAVSTRDTAIADVRRRAADIGVPAADLASKKLKATLTALKAAMPDRIADIDDLADAVQQRNLAANEVNKVTEKIGMEAARDYAAKNNLKVLSGLSNLPGKPGELDVLTVKAGGDEVSDVVALEAKGGGSRPGWRVEDGIRMRQGSPEYFRWMLEHDPAVRDLAQKYPHLEKAVNDGTVSLDYKLVQAKVKDQTVTVRVTEFILDPARFDPSKIGLGRLAPGR